MCNETVPLWPPTAHEYFSGIDTTNLVLTTLAVVLTFVTGILSTLHFHAINRFVTDEIVVGLLCWLAAVFPVTSFLSCVGLCVPRSLEIISAFNQIYFARVLFVFVFLVRHLFGGYEGQVSKLEKKVKLYTPPCCCMFCLPRVKPTDVSLRLIELLTWQAALLRPLLYFAFLVFVSDQRHGMPSTFTKTIDIIGSVSGLLAIWGANIVAHMARKPLESYRVYAIVRFLQLILLIHNVQGPLIELLAQWNVVGCTELLPAKTRATLWHHVCLVVEMTLLSILTTFALRPANCALFDMHRSRTKEETVELRSNLQAESLTL